MLLFMNINLLLYHLILFYLKRLVIIHLKPQQYSIFFIDIKAANLRLKFYLLTFYFLEYQ